MVNVSPEGGSIFPLLNDCEAADERRRYYVDADATGNNFGFDWSNAFTDLQMALSLADCTDEIWVAEGTYFPATASRSVSFLIPNGVEVYGGFAGTETVLSERVLGMHPSILSGDIGQIGDDSDNSYHVVEFLGTDTTTILNGFTITSGRAFNTPAPDLPVGGGILVYTDAEHPTAEPIIEHCRIENNKAVVGGGVACIGAPAGANGDWWAYPRIRHCKVIKNEATSNGGGIYFRWRGHPAKGEPLLYASEVLDNFAEGDGGGLYLDDIGGNVLLEETTFYHNYATEGGGIEGYQQLGKNLDLVLDRCIFHNNEGRMGSGISFFGLTNATTIEDVASFRS